MSLDVSLYLKTEKENTGLFVKENEYTVELTFNEVKEKFPNLIIEIDEECVFDANITHNLNTMADKAGIYEALWRPYRLHKDWKDTNDYEKELKFEGSVIMKAKDIISTLEKGLTLLKEKPEYFKKFNAENGWGTYEQFVPWVEEYLEACKQYPESEIYVSR